MTRTCKAEDIVRRFALPSPVKEILPWGQGHINDTYRVELEGGDYYILQRINPLVFREPYRVLENFSAVTTYLRQRIREEGGEEQRQTLHLLKAKDGRLGAQTGSTYWRMYSYIGSCYTLQKVTGIEDFAQAAKGFGHFLRLLQDFPAEDLYEVIPNFHDTPKRFAQLHAAMDRDLLGRGKDAQEEMEQALAMEEDGAHLMKGWKAGKLPVRVTHNDTKINNILFDETSRQALCVIDLDTIMPGLVAFDFGDAIRMGASSGAEDEPNLQKVRFQKEYYRAFLEAYLEETGSFLCEEERRSLAWGAYLMTLECGIRFLADYLDGDHYFKCQRPGQNLDRARTQLKLAGEIRRSLPDLQAMLETIES